MFTYIRTSRPLLHDYLDVTHPSAQFLSFFLPPSISDPVQYVSILRRLILHSPADPTTFPKHLRHRFSVMQTTMHHNHGSPQLRTGQRATSTVPSPPRAQPGSTKPSKKTTKIPLKYRLLCHMAKTTKKPQQYCHDQRAKTTKKPQQYCQLGQKEKTTKKPQQYREYGEQEGEYIEGGEGVGTANLREPHTYELIDDIMTFI